MNNIKTLDDLNNYLRNTNGNLNVEEWVELTNLVVQLTGENQEEAQKKLSWLQSKTE